MSRRYDAVFLDAQGTLLKPHPSTGGIYSSACRGVGHDRPEEEVSRAIRELWIELRPIPAGPEGRYDTSDEDTRLWWQGFNTRLFHKLELREGEREFVQALWEDFARPENWRLFPEVDEVLGELRARGYLMGVVSNWDSRLLSICESLGITRQMEFILASAPAGVEKPDPRIFRMALSLAGVAPERAIHVGDDYEADVLGARGAGIRALWLARDGETAEGEAPLRSLAELLDLLP